MIQKIKANWQNFAIGTLLVGIFILGFTITYLTLTFSKVGTKNSPAQATPDSLVKFNAPIKIDDQKGIFNTLLLGYGGEGHSGSYLTDSIIVVHVNTNTKKATLISIPRDLWVRGNHKINAEGSLNGFQNVGGPVKDVTGLPINYFVSVDFGGFVKLIDNLGAITVDVPKAFDDAFYPILGEENNVCGKTEEEIFVLKNKYSGFDLEKQFTCRYERLHFDKGPVSIDGTTALKFVRSRHGDSDFGRSERQFAILKGVLNKLISAHSLDKTSKTIDTLVKIVRTNLDIKTIRNLIEVFGNTSQYQLSEIHLTTDNVLNTSTSFDKQFILVPKAGNFNFSGIQKFIQSSI
ncbi:MAG TPA: LCP family protein [Patescibacteria group bacterium]|nr:LCP family protein [Patescibacteria group bacterium]